MSQTYIKLLEAREKHLRVVRDELWEKSDELEKLGYHNIATELELMVAEDIGWELNCLSRELWRLKGASSD